MKSVRECALDALDILGACYEDEGPHEGCSEFNNISEYDLCEPAIRRLAEENGHEYITVMAEVEYLEHSVGCECGGCEEYETGERFN